MVNDPTIANVGAGPSRHTKRRHEDTNRTPAYPLVSVVIPARNAEKTIEECLDSILDQTWKHLEVIVCDDASTDATARVVESIDDSRVRLLRNEIRRGGGAARDAAISASQGDWVAVCDADDLWCRDRIEALMDAAGTATDTMIFDDILECHHGPKGLIPWRRMRGRRAFGARHEPVDVPPAAWIASRHLLIKPLIPAEALRRSGIRHSTRQFAEDTEFFLDLIAQGMKLLYLPEAYYSYRISPGSMSSLRSRSASLIEVLDHAADQFRNHPTMSSALRRRSSRERRNGIYSEFVWCLKDREFRRASIHASKHAWVLIEFVRRAIRETPYQVHRLFHHGAGRNGA